MTACGPSCGWCGRCTAAWEREDDDEPEPDICPYCSRPFDDNDHTICAVHAALDNTFD